MEQINTTCWASICKNDGSLKHSVVSLSLNGSLRADGETFGRVVGGQGGGKVLNVGPGGGSGGTIRLFVQKVSHSGPPVISAIGGRGSSNGIFQNGLFPILTTNFATNTKPWSKK